MQLTFEPARLTGLAILAVAGATALSVGACSSSHDEKSPATSSPAAANGKAVVHGLIASVSGNAVQVTEATGTATVDVSPSAKISESTPAQLSDVAGGNCVTVVSTPAPAPGGPVTAVAVHLSPQGGDGKCPQPKETGHGASHKVERHGCFCGGQHHQRDRYRCQRQSRSNRRDGHRQDALQQGRLCNFAGHRTRQVHHRTRNQGWWRDAAGDGCRLGPRSRRQMP